MTDEAPPSLWDQSAIIAREQVRDWRREGVRVSQIAESIGVCPHSSWRRVERRVARLWRDLRAGVVYSGQREGAPETYALILRLVARRLALGWTQKRLALILGRPKRTVTSWENFEREPSPESAVAWARALGMQLRHEPARYVISEAA